MLRKADIVNRGLECKFRPFQKHGRMPGPIDCMGLIIHAGGKLVAADATDIPYEALPQQGFVLQMLAKYADPQPYFLRDGLQLADIIVLPQRGLSIHVGLIVALSPLPTALHVDVRHGCCDLSVEPKQLTCVFRYRGLAD